MGSPGAVLQAITTILIGLLLVISGAGAALMAALDGPSADAPVQAPLDDPAAAVAELPGLETDLPGPNAAAYGLPPGFEDLQAFIQWTQQAPLPHVEELVRAHAPEAGQRLIPTPDAFPGHDLADEESQRQAWAAWWLATQIAVLRQPTVGMDPLAAGIGAGAAGNHSGGDGGDGGNGDPVLTDSPVGDPRGLDRLWRLQTHGAPRILLSAGDAEETYLVTDRGVLFMPRAGANPEWMLQLEGVAGHAETIDRDGHKDLVVGMHDVYMGATTASIWVIDGDKEMIRYRGLSGERALVHWGLTDVDGDGEKDILGVDRSGHVTAVKLDGTEIYRKPIPLPDLPEEDGSSLPDPLTGFIMLALQRTGAEALGDATGNGVLDVFTTAWWDWTIDTILLGPMTTSSTVVNLISGKDGETVWTQQFEPAAGGFYRITVPTLTGDLTGDGHADVNVWDFSWGFFGPSSTNLYLAGETGLLLAKDEDMFFWMNIQGLPVNTVPHRPLAFVDRNGDGVKQIVTMQTWDAWGDQVYYEPTLHLRSLPPLPGGPTVTDGMYSFGSWWWMPGGMLQHAVHKIDDKEVFTLLVPHWVTDDDDPGRLMTVDENGFESQQLPQPLGQFAVNPSTGQRYAWTLQDDRWVGVDASLEPTGNGTRIILNSYPIIIHDKDGDGTPDLLIRRSLGYFWVSGRTGAIIDQVDRPMTTTLVGVSATHDGLVLERDPDHYILYNVITKQTEWMVSSTITDGGSVRGVADFTGDGDQEILLREWDWDYVEWRVYAPSQPGVIWKRQLEYGWVQTADLIRERPGIELLLEEETTSGDTKLSVFTPGDDESGARWSSTFGIASHLQIDHGTLAFLEDGAEGKRVIVLDGESGEGIHVEPLDGEHHLAWLRIVGDDRRTYLVYSHEIEKDGGDLREQHITTVDLTRQRTVSSFQVTDTIVTKETHELPFGGYWETTRIERTWPGPSPGDWNGNGVPDLALNERNWPVVRSLRDGEVLAVGPVRGAFTFTVDLNGNDREEIALSGGGALRLYAYDAGRDRLEQEDPLSRAQIVDPDEGDTNETLDRFFEGDTERSPGPGIVLVVFALVAAGALKSRRAHR